MTTTATELLEEFRQLAAEQGPDITLFQYRQVQLLVSPAVFWSTMFDSISRVSARGEGWKGKHVSRQLPH